MSASEHKGRSSAEPFTVSYEVEARLVVATAEGPANLEMVMAMAARARDIAATHGAPILYDLTAAVPGTVTRSDVFWMPRRLPALASAQARRLPVALLHKPAYTDLAHFWETTFRNAGLPARAFTDADAARAWLRDAKAP